MDKTLFVISGPSGVGKQRLTQALLRERSDLRLSISHTTRPKRAGEEDGREYHFVSLSVFEHMILNGEFVEFAQYPPDSSHWHYYGTTYHALDSAELLEIDTQGALGTLAFFAHAVLIFIRPGTLEELTVRLRQRGGLSEEAIAARTERAQEEMGEAILGFDYTITNTQGDAGFARALKELIDIIDRHRRT